jgi:DNA mismatch repair protein MutL
MPAAPPVIRQLTDAIANQIAAGEVVERPAAVVKELAENALDAGARRIVVRLEDGGRRLVEVEDDGHGMRPDDLRLAVSRHATSKLVDADDLFRIASLGFRGEALPSIAAVSEFSIASRPHDAVQGHELRLAGGGEDGSAPCAMAPGTRVAVRNLFWNVPARLKFLKHEAAETGHVTDQLMRLALSHPRVAFRLEINGRTAIDQPADETLEQRVRSLFGGALADRLLPVASGVDTMQLAGFIAHPQEARPTAKRQYVFLNGRYVKDRLLLAAVRDGFKGFLEPRLHGTVFLHLDIDPAQVDVNVHPTKSEVRFRREGEVFALVRGAVQQALAASAGGFARSIPTAGEGAAPVIQRTIVRPVPVTAPSPAMVAQGGFVPPAEFDARPRRSVTPADPVRRAAEPAPRYTATPVAATDVRRPDAGLASRAPSAAPESTTEPRSHLRRVVQLDRTYLLIETDDGITLVEQHVLHQRALALLLDPAAGAPAVHELPAAVPVTMLAHDLASLAPLLPELERVGIRCGITAPTLLSLRAHPPLLRRTHWLRFFTDLVATPAPTEAVETPAARIARLAAHHGAVKAGQDLSSDEQWELARLLHRIADGPTTIDFSWPDLARRFRGSPDPER